jgi:hypothetical protein
MKVTKINKFKVDLPSKGAFTIETEPDFPKLHTLCIASGKRGGGKSVAIANLVRTARQKGYYDRVWLITPTYNSNKDIWDIAGIQAEDVMEPDMGCINTLKKLVQADKDEWDEFLSDKELYAKYTKDMHSFEKINDNCLMNYMDKGFFQPTYNKPVWKYPIERPPRLACIIDDCMGTDLMSKRTAGLTNLCIRSRHVGDGLGISLFMLVQSYCSHGGVARPIRENCTHLMLFKINDE